MVRPRSIHIVKTMCTFWSPKMATLGLNGHRNPKEKKNTLFFGKSPKKQKYTCTHTVDMNFGCTKL